MNLRLIQEYDWEYINLFHFLVCLTVLLTDDSLCDYLYE